MLERFLGPAALLSVLLIPPVSRAQDSKSKATDSSDSTTVDASTLKVGEYLGKLLAPPGSDGKFSLRIDQYDAKDSAAATRATNQLNANLQRARQLEQQVAVNPGQQQVNALKKLYSDIRKQQAQLPDLYNISSKDIEFHAADGMTVRFLTPPIVYNDKGERKKFSSLDLLEMRGTDPNVPGYEAKLSDLQANQVIRVSLRTAKAASGDKAAPSAGSDKDKAKSTPKMEATMAVIVVAEDMTAVNQDNKDKKKGK
jgi:hypothetical protein